MDGVVLVVAGGGCSWVEVLSSGEAWMFREARIFVPRFGIGGV